MQNHPSSLRRPCAALCLGTEMTVRNRTTAVLQVLNTGSESARVVHRQLSPNPMPVGSL
jgi:hypothetical protein